MREGEVFSFQFFFFFPPFSFPGSRHRRYEELLLPENSCTACSSFVSPPPRFFFSSRFVLPFLRSALSVGKVKKKHKGDDLFSLPCACSHLALVVSFFDLRKPVRPFCTSVRVQKGARERESERARERESERVRDREGERAGERESAMQLQPRGPLGCEKKHGNLRMGSNFPKAPRPQNIPQSLLLFTLRVLHSGGQHVDTQVQARRKAESTRASSTRKPLFLSPTPKNGRPFLFFFSVFFFFFFFFSRVLFSPSLSLPPPPPPPQTPPHDDSNSIEAKQKRKRRCSRRCALSCSSQPSSPPPPPQQHLSAPSPPRGSSPRWSTPSPTRLSSSRALWPTSTGSLPASRKRESSR